MFETRVVTLAPTDPDRLRAATNRAGALLDADRPGEALELLTSELPGARSAWADRPEELSGFLIPLGRALAALGRPQEALAPLLECFQRLTDDDRAPSARSAEAAAPSSSYWIGLTRDATNVYAPEGRDEPGFPEAPERGPCSGCFARTGDDGRFPDASASPSAGTIGCLVADPGLRGPWKRTSCTNAGRDYDVLCEREPPGALSETCTGGICVRVPLTEKRYLYVPSPASSAEAKDVCRTLGGTLAKLESSEEREALARQLARIAPESSVWIGLSRQTADGPFQWEDGTSETTKLWAEGEPDREGRPRTPTRAFLDLRGFAYDRRLLRIPMDDKSRPCLCQY